MDKYGGNYDACRKTMEANVTFQESCVKAGLPNHMNAIHSRKGDRLEKADDQSLGRQASKWNNRKGKAYKLYKGLA